jgi:hypothetical protein
VDSAAKLQSEINLRDFMAGSLRRAIASHCAAKSSTWLQEEHKRTAGAANVIASAVMWRHRIAR